jgi:flagellar FliL protein
VSAQAAPAPAPPEAPKKKSKKLLFIILAVVLVAGGGVAAWFFTAGAKAEAPAAEEKLPTQYFAMEPSFVVNLADTDAVRYLQADVQIATRDPETLTALQAHGPALRNRLLLLFGQQLSPSLAQRTGKERQQEKALAEVRAVLKKEGAPDKVESVIFTSLVTQ